MIAAVLQKGTHSHEHFHFEECPDRILVQTKEGSGVYGRTVASIYQKTGNVEDGCHEFWFMRTVNRTLNGLVETKYA